MKKNLCYLLLIALLATACGDKENDEPIVDPNKAKELILGDWEHTKSVQYQDFTDKYGVPQRDTIYFGDKFDYVRFTKSEYFTGVKNGTDIYFDPPGDPYLIKGDSILKPFHGLMIFAGDSLTIEYNFSGAGYDKLQNIEVLHRFKK